MVNLIHWQPLSNYLKGKIAEKKAAKYLSNKNYHIIKTNWRTRIGEIDIIARDDTFLCFIEVKFRKDNSFGLPKEAVDSRKRHKLIILARQFLQRENLSEENIRFDVIEVDENNINLIKDAFTGGD